MSTTITKTERRQRERYVRGGDWNDRLLEFSNGSRIHAIECQIVEGRFMVYYSSRPGLPASWAALDIAEVVHVR